MTDKQPEQRNAPTPEAIATLRASGWSEAQIEAQCQQFERIRAAGGFQNWVVMCEAARIQSEARGYTVPPENFRVREYGTITEQLAAIAAEPDNGAPPALWAFWFAAELRERNPGMDSAARTVAEGQIMRAFEAHADALPLRQPPSGLLWPKGQPLPPGWREGLYMTKAELRAWAKECAPDFLGSALLAEPQAAPAGEVATIAGPGTVRHNTKGKRAQPLDAEIEAAKHEATNPNDAHAVYAVLQRWAEERKAPFIGFAEGEGIKYQTPAGEVDFFRFDALRKRMSRAANAR
ncbi:hypothetical protein [Thiomonas bhubaneswarensis]|uniref:Uncharacterized protein n=1 Tax=Thiomonas bhubaneswarensis TaxID=339866 RepID=A0A0K6I9W8_9BURK|nr:hypothetical protein [Thiomonas bhubaneswarensis]CUA99921.1 hypothetical protein Ga0061069_110156 [Thiomonas bhubaneswarensis]